MQEEQREGAPAALAYSIPQMGQYPSVRGAS